MSEQTPTIRTGDWVRIMQTPDMENAGLANLRGVVDGGIVRLDGTRVSFVVVPGRRDVLHIPDSSLMKVAT